MVTEGGQRTLRAVAFPARPAARHGRRGAARRFRTNRTVRRWILAWVGAPALAVVNGAARELVYRDQLGDSTADQASVASLIALLAVYFSLLQRRWPLGSRREAWSVGAIWAALAVLFEFGFGHYVEGDLWEDLFGTYDIAAGNLWILIPLWIAVGPETARAVAEKQADGTSQLGRGRRLR